MMVDYSKRTDAQIAQKVFFWVNDKLCPEGGLAHISDGGFFYFTSNGVKKSFDPCNNPADAWPIIYGNKISIEFDCGDSTEPQTTWCHMGNLSCGINYQSNPLRAAMIVFLMMQEAKNG